jgi:hypothetical protein
VPGLSDSCGKAGADAALSMGVDIERTKGDVTPTGPRGDANPAAGPHDEITT